MDHNIIMRRIIIIIIIKIDKIIVILIRIRKNRKLCGMDKEYSFGSQLRFFLYSISNYLNKTIISLDRKSFIIIIIGVIWVKMWDFIDE